MGLASSFPAAAVCSVGRSGCGICHDGLMLNFIMSAACVVQLNVCVMNSAGVVAHGSFMLCDSAYFGFFLLCGSCEYVK